jgi:spore coat polysaccharide biosynthesis protein SpsF
MILAIVQARFSSTRLPGKVLMPILGQPMLGRQLERIRQCSVIDKTVVATSCDATDDAIESFCNAISIECFRGNLIDVLDRFYRAALSVNGVDHVVRITGDCPLVDPKLIDAVTRLHLEHGYDYTTNTNPPTFPDGLDVEVMKFSALEAAWHKASKPSEREHVTPYVRQNSGLFKLGNLESPMDLSHLRWTVDEPQDFELVSQIYQLLYPRKETFSTEDILQLLVQMPELLDKNNQFTRNEGYMKSLSRD